MELNNGDIIYFMTNNPQKIKGRRVNKLIIYEKLLQDDIIYVHDALIPCLRDCTTENVFTIPDRHEEKIIDILRQL
jgi:ribonucleotide monophosphatase NagD (HAD superfamily)